MSGKGSRSLSLFYRFLVGAEIIRSKSLVNFFQFINPLLPFTHAVNLLRESAGGIYWPNAIPQLIILSLLFIVFSIIGTWAYPYLTDVTKKLNNVSKRVIFFIKNQEQMGHDVLSAFL